MLSKSLQLLRDESGVSLLEVLVATISGLVVIAAIFSVLEVSLHQSTRLADIAQATQSGRTAMTRVVDELHSACLSPGFQPVQAGSNDHELIVINAYSKEAEISFKSVRKDKIEWNKETRTLTDYTYFSNGGTWPTFTFASVPTPANGVRLGEKERISQTENEKKEATPVFQYYAYAIKPSTSTSAPSSSLNEAEPLKPGAGLGSKEAETVASVLVSFRTAPVSGTKESTRNVDATNQVTFAFSAPNSESTIEDGPCK